jgi:hypothetical protein
MRGFEADRPLRGDRVPYAARHLVDASEHFNPRAPPGARGLGAPRHYAFIAAANDSIADSSIRE